MTFVLDQVVTTPKGKGYVVYVEDGYIEVDVAGNEFSFEAPFSGVMNYVQAPTRAEILAEKRAAASKQANKIIDRIPADIVTAGKMTHMVTGRAVIALGGSHSPWEELSAFQQINFMAVALGVPTNDILNKF